MSKVVFWALVILVVLLLSRLAGRAAAKRRATGSTSTYRPDIPRPPRRPTAMVQCAHCNVHLPEAEAVRHQGQYWCSLEHAQLGAPEPPKA